RGETGRGGERVEHALVAGVLTAGLVHLADDDTGPQVATARRQREGAEQGVEQRRLATAVGSDDRDPFLPGDFKRDGAEDERAPLDDGVFEAGDDVAAAGRRGEREPELPPLPGLLDDIEPGQRLLGDADLRGLLLGSVDEEPALRFVVVP